MSLMTLLRGASLIGAFVWTLYLFRDWSAFNEAARWGVFESVIAQARLVLIVQSVVVIVLYIFGFFGGTLSGSANEDTKGSPRNLSATNDSGKAILQSAYTESTDESETRDCPFCAERIKAIAKLCRFCGTSVEPTVLEGGSSHQPVSPVNGTYQSPSQITAQSRSAIEVASAPSEPIPLVAHCPNCNGIITTSTEACNHCNTWLGAGADLKPLPVAVDPFKVASQSVQTESSTDVETRDCPYCAESIEAVAKLCRFCGTVVEPTAKGSESATQIVSPVNSTKKSASLTAVQSRSAIEIDVTQHNPIPVVALCPNCNGIITAAAEACNHCNAWLGDGADLKPQVVRETDRRLTESSSQAQVVSSNQNIKGKVPSFSKQITLTFRYAKVVRLLALAFSVFLFYSVIPHWQSFISSGAFSTTFSGIFSPLNGAFAAVGSRILELLLLKSLLAIAMLMLAFPEFLLPKSIVKIEE